jgi:hypothetical protein
MKKHHSGTRLVTLPCKNRLVRSTRPGVLSKDFASASTERRLRNEENTNASPEMNLLRRRSLEFGEKRETLQGRQGTRRAELSQPRDSPNRRISDLTATDLLLTSENRASQALKLSPQQRKSNTNRQIQYRTVINCLYGRNPLSSGDSTSLTWWLLT